MKNDVSHENLALLFNVALAGQLRDSLTRAGLEPDEAWPLVESAVFDLAMMMDQGTIEVNGRVFRPRISFVSDKGDALPGSAGFDHLHDYASVTEDDLKAQKGFAVTF